MNSPKVSIIIVNYNQPELTLGCLESLQKISYKNVEIILVDNGSKDDISQIVKKRFPKVIFLKSEDNKGFTGGNNLGYTKATGHYILLLNNDTKVTPNFIEPLVLALAKDKELGIVQSKIFVMDKPNLLDNVVSYQTINGFLYHKGYLEKDKPEYQEFMLSFSVKGACMMMKRDILKLGLLDDKYFAYFEETDLCWRTWLMGYRVGFVPSSVIYHKMGSTSSKMNRYFINYHSFKNRIRTILKNAQLSTLVWMMPLHLLLCFGVSLYFLVIGQLTAARSIMEAMIWNMRNLADTLRLRWQIQRERTTSDFQIFTQVMQNPSPLFYLRHLSLIRRHLSNDRKA